jgi:hypothetical protein
MSKATSGADLSSIDPACRFAHAGLLIREESIKAMGGELNDLALEGLSIDLHGQSLADVL